MMSHSLMSCTKSTNCVNGRKGKPGDTSWKYERWRRKAADENPWWGESITTTNQHHKILLMFLLKAISESFIRLKKS